MKDIDKKLRDRLWGVLFVLIGLNLVLQSGLLHQGINLAGVVLLYWSTRDWWRARKAKKEKGLHRWV